ncbi:sensor histidine kinase [Cohnella soli]|uniref:Sensor histidine kinase n=1 Tax=Cohnella soli TaxID=425005 RepID=A0ABW0I3D2_9BACL
MMGKAPIALQNGIFMKLFATFLAVFFPIYVIGSLMSKTGVDLLRQQILVLMEQKSAFFVSSFDAEMARISQLQVNFLVDPDLQAISIRNESLRVYEQTKAVNDLNFKLSALAASSRYVKEAFVLMPGIGKRLSSIDGLSDMSLDEYDAFLQRNMSSPGLLHFDKRIFLSLGYPSKAKPLYLLVIELSAPKIGEVLADQNTTGNGIAYIAGNRKLNGFLIPASNATPDKLEAMNKSLTLGGERFSIGSKTYLSFKKAFAFADLSFVTLVQEDQILKPVSSFKTWLWVLSAISIIVVLIVSYSLLRFIHRPLLKLVRAFKKVELGQFEIHLQHRNKDEFDYLYRQFNQMVGKLKVLVQEVYEQTIRSQKAELKQLQSQINPHFLYNSLYILYQMAQDEDVEGVSRLSMYLGDYFKFITQNKSDFVPLSNEIHHAGVYCSIQQMRIGKRITFHFEVSGSVDRWEVPRLIIQPFLENAIVHGHEDTMKGGLVHFRVICEPKSLTIEIEDNGKGVTPDQMKEWEERRRMVEAVEDHHAIWNVHRRLQLRYGAKSGVVLKPNAFGGVTVTIRIEIEEGGTNLE